MNHLPRIRRLNLRAGIATLLLPGFFLPFVLLAQPVAPPGGAGFVTTYVKSDRKWRLSFNSKTYNSISERFGEKLTEALMAKGLRHVPSVGTGCCVLTLELLQVTSRPAMFKKPGIDVSANVTISDGAGKFIYAHAYTGQSSTMFDTWKHLIDVAVDSMVDNIAADANLLQLLAGHINGGAQLQPVAPAAQSLAAPPPAQPQPAPVIAQPPAPASPDPLLPQRSGVVMRRVEVKPPAVRAGDSFELEIEYSASDGAGSSATVPVQLTYSIAEAGTNLYEAPAIVIDAPNGRAAIRTQSLKAAAKPGTYTITVHLRCRGSAVEESLDFAVQ